MKFRNSSWFLNPPFEDSGRVESGKKTVTVISFTKLTFSLATIDLKKQVVESCKIKFGPYSRTGQYIDTYTFSLITVGTGMSSTLGITISL